MDKYKIKFSSKAQNDIITIIKYIRDILKEPVIAKRYVKLFQDEIKKLETFPNKFEVVNEERIKYLGVRKLIIRNYIVFYRVNEEKSIVSIERIMYGAINWKDVL